MTKLPTQTAKPPPFDWDLVLQQMGGAYQREPTNVRRLALHNAMLNHVERERRTYKRALMAAAREAAREMEVIWDDDPEKDLIFAKHWAEWRGAIRAKMRWLDEVEESLDQALVRSMEGGSEPYDPR